MYINCIHCGHKFDIGRSYDDYEGPVRCATCRGMLTIRTEDGSIRAVRSGISDSASLPAPRLASEESSQAPASQQAA